MLSKMKKQELDFILQEGEGFKIEFKENVKHLDREVVTFFGPGDSMLDKVGDRVSENQKKILKYIKEDVFISASDLADKVGISKRKIEENISKLKEKNLLIRIGSAKGGHWEVR